MLLWVIYGNSKFSNFSKKFDSKKHYFSFLGGHFGHFADFFFKMRFWSKCAQKWSKMVVFGFSRSQKLSLCNFEQYWTNLIFDFLVTLQVKILHVIVKWLGVWTSLLFSKIREVDKKSKTFAQENEVLYLYTKTSFFAGVQNVLSTEFCFPIPPPHPVKK